MQLLGRPHHSASLRGEGRPQSQEGNNKQTYRLSPTGSVSSLSTDALADEPSKQRGQRDKEGDANRWPGNDEDCFDASNLKSPIAGEGDFQHALWSACMPCKKQSAARIAGGCR